MPITAERFAQGMTFTEYMARMRDNRDTFMARYEQATVPPAARALVCESGLPLRVLIITEDWCGDAVSYLPLLGRLAACAGTWDLRIFRRDEQMDLADEYLNLGKWRSVPVVVFYDPALRELGRFIERPALANAERQVVIDRLAQTHPAIAAGAPFNDQSDTAKALLMPALRDLRLDRQAAWQAAVVDEVCAALEQMREAAPP